jgi:capsular polysaccharide biosynthesis protein/tRNA A-37 threonylcarbamoyl transferase component Bud32
VAVAFPQLEVQALIGAGGMGAVFRARQPKLNRLVALKVLPASLVERDPAFAERFELEGQMLARLHHPNIVAVYDSGRAGDFFYLLMEHVDGVNLRQAMRASRFTPAQALGIVPRICDALQYAHDEGVLHRDIKPENILLDARGRVKLADFGIAKLIGDGTPESTEFHAIHASNPANLTQAGTALGTPSYMAPEQRETPADVDHRADIYSLGVVFYELLTGELPHGAFAQPSAKSDADPRVDAIVQQALEKERARRQGSASEVKTQVETLASTPPQPSSPAFDSPAVLVVAGIVLIITFMTVMVPKLTGSFEGSGQPLPPATQILVNANRLLVSYWWAILLAGAGAYALTRIYRALARRRAEAGNPAAGSRTSRRAVRRTALIGAALLLVLGAALLVADRLLPPVYFAKVTMELKEDNSGPEQVFGGDRARGYSQQFVTSQLNIIQKTEVLYPVIERLDLTMEFSPPGGARLPLPRVFLKLNKSMQLREVRNTQLIEIGVFNTNPQLAANIANTIAVVYQEVRIIDSERRIMQRLANQEEEIRKKVKEVHEAALKMAELREIEGIVDPNPESADSVVKYSKEETSPAEVRMLNIYLAAKSNYLLGKRVKEAAQMNVMTERMKLSAGFQAVKIWEKAERPEEPIPLSLRRLRHAFSR